MRNENKKILILTGVFSPAIGGPAAQLEALCSQLFKCGYKIKVLTYGQSDKEYSYSVIRISNKIPSFLRKINFIIIGLILATRADVIYSWDLYVSGFTGLLAKKLLGKKVINRFAGDSAWEKAAIQNLIGYDDVLSFQDKKYSNRIERWKKRRKKILLNSDTVIVVSEFLKEIALKIGVLDKNIKVIYNSVDFLTDVKYEPKNDSIELVTIARLVPWKGIDMLIEIMPEIIAKYKKISLVVIGSGPEEEKLKDLIGKLNLERYVFIKGKIDRDKISQHLSTANLFLLNTNYEGLSHTILEAIKVGVPVITTKAGGNIETIIDKQTGLLVNYKDKKQWIKAINLLLDNRNLATKLANQAREYSKIFNWENLVRKTINMINN